DQTCDVLSDGNVRCWGENGHGQLGEGDTIDRGGNPGETGDARPPVDVSYIDSFNPVVTSGGQHTCALLIGTVKCWGRNTDGQLGVGDHADRGDEPGEMGDGLPRVDLGYW